VCGINGVNIITVHGDIIPPIEQLSMQQLATHLCNFGFEVRKKIGEEFPPNSLRSRVTAIFMLTTMIMTTTNYFTPCACSRGNNIEISVMGAHRVATWMYNYCHISIITQQDCVG
jgi:hypothetical protein